MRNVVTTIEKEVVLGDTANSHICLATVPNFIVDYQEKGAWNEFRFGTYEASTPEVKSAIVGKSLFNIYLG